MLQKPGSLSTQIPSAHTQHIEHYYTSLQLHHNKHSRYLIKQLFLGNVRRPGLDRLHVAVPSLRKWVSLSPHTIFGQFIVDLRIICSVATVKLIQLFLATAREIVTIYHLSSLSLERIKSNEVQLNLPLVAGHPPDPFLVRT